MLAALRHEILATLHSELTAIHAELRAQTWRLASALLATVTFMTAILRLT